MHDPHSHAAYKRALLQLYHDGKLPTGPGLYRADVYHDGDCAIWRGGECDCEPEIEIKPERGRMQGPVKAPGAS